MAGGIATGSRDEDSGDIGTIETRHDGLIRDGTGEDRRLIGRRNCVSKPVHRLPMPLDHELAWPILRELYRSSLKSALTEHT